MDHEGLSGTLDECGAGDLRGALAGLKHICFLPATEGSVVEEAADAFVKSHGWRHAERLFRGLLDKPGVNPQVGVLWVNSFVARGAWHYRDRLCKLDPESALGRRARFTYIGALGEQKKPHYLRRLLWREKDALRKDSQCWGQVGCALADNQLYRETVGWMRNWRTQPGVESWMLSGLVLAQRSLGYAADAEAVSRHALSLRGDHATAQHQLWLACCDALGGKTDSARARLSTVSFEALPDFYQALHALTDAAIAVLSAPGNERPAVFEQHRQVLQEPKLKASFQTQALRSLAGRAIRVMAKAAHARPFGMGRARGSRVIVNRILIMLAIVLAAVIIRVCLTRSEKGHPPALLPIQLSGTNPLPLEWKSTAPGADSAFFPDQNPVQFQDEKGKPIELKIQHDPAPGSSR